MNDSTVYAAMIKVVEYLANDKSLQYTSDHKLNEILNYLKPHVENFKSIYTKSLSKLKNRVNNLDNVGLLWFSYCDDNDIYYNLEKLRRNRVLSI